MIPSLPASQTIARLHEEDAQGHGQSYLRAARRARALVSDGHGRKSQRCDLLAVTVAIYKSLHFSLVSCEVGRTPPPWHVQEGRRAWYLRSSWRLVGAGVIFSPLIFLCHRPCHCISFLLLP